MARQPNAVPPKPAVNGHEPEIEIADDPVIVDDLDVAAAAAAVAEPDPGIEDLRAQLEAERTRREAAEAERDRIAQQRQADQREVVDTRLLVIDSTITTKETEKREWQSKKLAAKEAGDYQAEVEADDALQVINIDLKQAKLGKSRLETEIEEAKAAPQTPADNFEASIANLPAEAQRWAREHKTDFTDPKRNAKIQAAHYDAVGDGIQPFTPEYFEKLEERLGLTQRQESREEPAQPSRSQMPPAAPPSRAAGVGGGGREIARGIRDLGNGKYRVSAEVAEAAAMSGITVQEYVEQAKKLSRGSDGQLH